MISHVHIAWEPLRKLYVHLINLGSGGGEKLLQDFPAGFVDHRGHVCTCKLLVTNSPSLLSSKELTTAYVPISSDMLPPRSWVVSATATLPIMKMTATVERMRCLRLKFMMYRIFGVIGCCCCCCCCCCLLFAFWFCGTWLFLRKKKIVRRATKQGEE